MKPNCAAKPKPGRESPRPAVLVSQGKFEEADNLIHQASPTEPSVEGAAVLRAFKRMARPPGPMDPSGRSFRFASASQPIGRMGSKRTWIFWVAVSASSRAEKPEDYDRFRQGALIRFASTTNGVAAERVVKICLLEAPVQSVLESLAPLARVAENAFANPDSHDKDSLFARPGHRFLWRFGSIAGPLRQEYRVGQTLPGLSRSPTRPEKLLPESNLRWIYTKMAKRTKHLRNSARSDNPFKTNSIVLWKPATAIKVFGSTGFLPANYCARPQA
jgi:hypothetical protein